MQNKIRVKYHKNRETLFTNALTSAKRLEVSIVHSTETTPHATEGFASADAVVQCKPGVDALHHDFSPDGADLSWRTDVLLQQWPEAFNWINIRRIAWPLPLEPRTQLVIRVDDVSEPLLRGVGGARRCAVLHEQDDALIIVCGENIVCMNGSDMNRYDRQRHEQI